MGPDSSRDGPSLPFVVGPDARNVVLGETTPVILIGHFDDRRADSCASAPGDICADVFWVDAIWADGRLDESVWQLGSQPAATTSHDDIVPWAHRLSGDGATILSLGLIEAISLRTLEPAFHDLLPADGGWVWHITALDPATGRTRTFVVPEQTILNARAGGDYETFEIVGDQVTGTGTDIN